MTLLIYGIYFFLLQTRLFLQVKNDFHIEKIDVIKLSKSQFHRKHIDGVKSSNFFFAI